MRTLSFGRYKGRTLDQVPRSYLEWLLTWDGLRPSTKEAVEAELARRGDNLDHHSCDDEGGQEESPRTVTEALAAFQQEVEAASRRLMQRLESLSVNCPG